MAPNGAGISVFSDSDSDRTAYVRVRYGSSKANTNLNVTVNGQLYAQTLDVLPTVDGEDVAFAEAKFVVEFHEGNNEINVFTEMSGTQYELVLDDITISTPEHEFAAKVHTRVNSLSTPEKSQRIDYLQQIDRGRNIPE